MNSKSFLSVLAIILFSGLLLAPFASAQYTSANQTNIISGVTSNWTGDYVIGYGSGDQPSFDALFIQNSGVLSNGTGSVGTINDYNLAVVSGNGSVWYNDGNLAISQSGAGFNSLIITNGGVVYDSTAYIGDDSPADGSYSSVLVSGVGSVLSNRNDLIISGGRGCTLTIADGGAVFNNNSSVNADFAYDMVLVTGKGSIWNVNGSIQLQASQMIVSNGGFVRCNSATLGDTTSSQVVVTGTGSVWYVAGSVLGSGLSESVTVADGGVASASSLHIGRTFVSGGSLYVTNGLNTSALTVSFAHAALTLNSGNVTVDNLVDSGTTTSIAFNGGTLRSKGTTISNGLAFTVGDGTDAATFILDTGGSGFHSFANGLMISSNGALRGVGTIIGSATFNAGGLLAPGMSPASITFSNSLTLAPNSTFAVELDGRAEGQYDRIVALDTVSVSNSILSVSLGFTPSIGDSFTIISNLSAMAVLGTFITSDGAALPDGAEFSADGTTFQIDYTANPYGQDVTLTAVIPEPSSLLLATFGVLLICPLFKRRWPSES